MSDLDLSLMCISILILGLSSTITSLNGLGLRRLVRKLELRVYELEQRHAIEIKTARCFSNPNAEK